MRLRIELQHGLIVRFSTCIGIEDEKIRCRLHGRVPDFFIEDLRAKAVGAWGVARGGSVAWLRGRAETGTKSVQCLLEGFAGCELRNLAFFDIDGGARLGVSAGPRFSFDRFEGAESDQGDAVAFGQGIGDRLYHTVYCCLGFLFGADDF